jgi:hypothetical protein
MPVYSLAEVQLWSLTRARILPGQFVVRKCGREISVTLTPR